MQMITDTTYETLPDKFDESEETQRRIHLLELRARELKAELKLITQSLGQLKQA